jgi:4-amino-4-deoxychorismate lyase
MTARMLVNGLSGDTVSALDRGLSYGDGLFETIRFVGDSAPLWSRHMQRLDESCRRLQLPAPAALQLLREARAVAHDMPQSVVRMTLTRGIGARGYASPVSPQVTRVVAAFEAPAMDGDMYFQGIRLRVCTTRLAEQPLLAGMKHLNRLEQVLARAEWNDPAIAEGVLCDARGRVISATMANLFAVVDGRLMTPAVDRCGVAGVARAEVLAVCPEAEIGELTLEALLGASEVFLSSSVRGILPVCSLNGRDYVRGDMTRHLQRHWHDLGFSMEQGG